MKQVPGEYTSNLPIQFDPVQAIHRACRDGIGMEVEALIKSYPTLIDCQDLKVNLLLIVAWMDSSLQSNIVWIRRGCKAFIKAWS